MVFLTRHLFAPGEHGLGFAEIDVDVIALATTNRTSDDVAYAVFVIVIDAVLLELAKFLHDRLAGRLGRDATELGGIDFFLDDFTDLRTSTNRLGFLNMDLDLGIAYGINHPH